METQKSIKHEKPAEWWSEFLWLGGLGALGVAASYLSVTIPYVEVYIEGRWIFGYMGFALLPHWWSALLLAVILSLSRPVGVYPLWVIFVGNMMYALPALLVIRLVHRSVLTRLRALPWYGLSWLLLTLGCYQAFTTPALWGFLAYLNGQPVWENILVGWREQPFLVESFLVGIISALAMLVTRSNAALRESRWELRTTLYSIGDGVIAADTAGRIRRMNPVAERLTGWREAEAIGKPLEDVFRLLDEETRAPVANLTSQVVREARVVNLADRALLVSRDGAEYPIADSVAPIRDANERVSGVVLIFRDQTEERAAQKARQESHTRLLLALRNACMGVWEWDIARGQVDYYGDYETIFGTPDGVPDNVLEEFGEQLHPDDREWNTATFRRTLETGADFDNTYRTLWPDGSLQWMHAYGKLSRDGEGRPQRLVGTVRNVTERKRSEEERARLNAQILDQAEQMAQVLAAVPVGILLLDADGRVLQANPIAQQGIAVLEGIAVGDVLTHLGDRPLADLLTTPPTRGLRHEVEWEKRLFEVITRPIARGPEPGHWVLVVEDVTLERETRARLQQQEQLAIVGQLAAGIAHDFNNIMAVISLYTQMTLRETPMSVHCRERMETILQQIRRATALIQQVLDFSRRAVLERQAIDLASFLDDVVKLLARTVPENINITLTHGRDDYTVNADPTRLQQAIMNLVVNARDAMPEGGELCIALSRATTAEIHDLIPDAIEIGAWVRLTVTDTGSGIPPEALPHIFEPFFTTKEVGKGTGLGLAQVYGIVKHHEGHITVASQPGAGTTFTIYLPASSSPRSAALATEPATLAHGQGETILVVEDNSVVRKALVEGLTSLNYRVVEARDGQEALTLLTALVAEPAGGGIAVILSDLVMPQMGGQALFLALRQRGIKTPLIMLSGHPMESALEELQAQGLAGWMLKPPDIEELSSLLARVLRPAG